MTSTLLTLLFLNVLQTAPTIRSVAERSDYTRTASEAEVDAILAAAAEASPQIERFTLGESHEGRPIQAVRIGFEDASTEAASPQSERLTVVIIGGIHSGECAGKEALCTLLGEIAAGAHPEWFPALRIVAVPSLSPDSNTRRSPNNRPGQVGPSEGMGERPNAQGLDLNRDFIKLETPEIRALVAACNRDEADVLIDLHTTNGSQHRYALTYDPPHHPLTPAPITRFLRGGLLPYVTERATAESLPMFYYGNFDRAHTRWTTYGYEGRYSTNYMGLRGGLGILSEAYSYADYPTRIAASYALMQHTLDYLVEQRDTAAEVLRAAAMLPSPGEPIALRAEVAAFPEPSEILGYKPDPAPEETEREPFTYRVQYFGRFEASEREPLPAAYWIPRSEQATLALLDRHGIAYGDQQPGRLTEIEQFRIEQRTRAKRPFQGHRMVSLSGRWETTEFPNKEPGVWVPTDQPLARVAAVILQPESADSIATWNVVPYSQLEPGSVFPVRRAFRLSR